MAYVEDVSALAGVGLHDASDDVAFDQLALLLGGLPEGRGGQAVQISHGAGGGFVEEADRVGGKELALAARLPHAKPEIFGGVLWSERLDLEAVMEPRVERAIAAQGEPVAQFGETDEHNREQCAAVPLIIQQDMQMVEGVLMQEVGFVDEEHRVDALAGELLDVGRHRIEEVAGSGRGCETEGETELTV